MENFVEQASDQNQPNQTPSEPNPWIAALLNFILLGAGYIYNRQRVIFGVALTVVALFATYVEFTIKTKVPDLFFLAFVEFFFLAIIFAIDGYYEATKLRQRK